MGEPVGRIGEIQGTRTEERWLAPELDANDVGGRAFEEARRKALEHAPLPDVEKKQKSDEPKAVDNIAGPERARLAQVSAPPVAPPATVQTAQPPAPPPTAADVTGQTYRQFAEVASRGREAIIERQRLLEQQAADNDAYRSAVREAATEFLRRFDQAAALPQNQRQPAIDMVSAAYRGDQDALAKSMERYARSAFGDSGAVDLPRVGTEIQRLLPDRAEVSPALDQAGRTLLPELSAAGRIPADRAAVLSAAQSGDPRAIQDEAFNRFAEHARSGITRADLDAEKARLQEWARFLPNPSAYQTGVEAAATEFSRIHPGDRITTLNSDRLPGMRQIMGLRATEGSEAERSQRDQLKGLLADDLDLATRHLATPGDELDRWNQDMKARRPGDADFARVTDEVSQAMREVWAAAGRTHAVFDPLKGAQSPEAFRGEVLRQFDTIARTTPTEDAINNHARMLSQYLPEQRGDVEAATQHFLVGRPGAAADEIRAVYDRKGAQASAAKLRELTDPTQVDPLTAALTFRSAQPTINQIAATFNAAQLGSGVDAPARMNRLVREHTDTFADLSAAADSAARSPAGASAVRETAQIFTRQLLENAPASSPWPQLPATGVTDPRPVLLDGLGTMTAESVAAGYGATLPLEIASQLRAGGNAEFANHITRAAADGADQLKNEVRRSVETLREHLYDLAGPMTAWRPFLSRENAERAAREYLTRHPEFADRINKDLEHISNQGYQVTRLADAVNRYGPLLAGLPAEPALMVHGQGPAESDRELNFALAASGAGIMDATRADNLRWLTSGQASDAHSLLYPPPFVPVDASRPVRSLRNSWMKTYNMLGEDGAAQAARRAAQNPGTPLGLGINLLGASMYMWGIHNQGLKAEQGGPNAYLSAGLADVIYPAGAAVDATQFGAGLFAQGRGLTNLTREQLESLRGWDRFIANTANRTGIVNQLYGTVRNASAGWNAVGALHYAVHGDYARAGAYGAASVGSLMSSFARRLALQSAGTWLALGGSVATVAMDVRENLRRAARLEGPTNEYLQLAGVQPEIARSLAEYDTSGVGMAPRLEAIARQQGIEPRALLDWAQTLPADFAQHFMNFGLYHVQPDETGQFPASHPTRNLQVIGAPVVENYVASAEDIARRWPAFAGRFDEDRSAADVIALTLQGAIEFARMRGYPLPAASH